MGGGGLKGHYGLTRKIYVCVSDTTQHHYDKCCISFNMNIITIVIELIIAVATVVVPVLLVGREGVLCFV